jgi:hypothetical protein
VQQKKLRHTKKRKKQISIHRSENFGYQKDNPLTIYFEKRTRKKAEVK